MGLGLGIGLGLGLGLERERSLGSVSDIASRVRSAAGVPPG